MIDSQTDSSSPFSLSNLPATLSQRRGSQRVSNLAPDRTKTRRGESRQTHKAASMHTYDAETSDPKGDFT